MRLLLDTHILLWSFLEPHRLSPTVAGELEGRHNELWLSPVTTWEIILLSEKARVQLDPDPVRWVRRVLDEFPFREAPLTHGVAIRSRQVNLPHRDPADRFIAATAAIYDLTLVTADARLYGGEGFQVLPNSE